MESGGPPFKRFIFILIDGSPYEVFRTLLENGDLPNIKRYIVERGCLNRAVSVFPSTTGPAFIPFLMGLYPGTAGIPGIRWLSKSHFCNPGRFTRPSICSYMGLDGLSFEVDLPTNAPTLFDFFSPVSNIYNLLARGCPPGKNRTRSMKPFVYTYAHFSHRWRFVNQIAARQLRKAAEAGDRFIFCLFPAVDTLSHLSHIRSPQVLQTYREIDAAIGTLVDILQRANTLEETLILITSDHGMTDTHTHVDVVRHLDDAGWRCLHYPPIWRRRTTAASMVSGNGMTHLYFKNNATGRGWGKRTPFEQLDRIGVVSALSELEGVGLVAGQSESGHLIVHNRTGYGRISYSLRHTDTTNGHNIPSSPQHADLLRFSYQFTGADPLGYGAPYEGLSAQETLLQSYDSTYPDAIVQLWQIFKSDRTGDLVISAQNGYDLRARYEIPEHHATHGALIAEHLHIPLALNYPIAEQYIRSVDMFPTVLSLCGQSVDGYHIDGRAVT